jgi:hypothetical protein
MRLAWGFFAALILAILGTTLALVRPPAAGAYLFPCMMLTLIGLLLARQGWDRRRTLLTPHVLGGVLIAWAFGVSPVLVAAFDHRPAYAWVGQPLTDALAPVGWLHLMGVVLGLGVTVLCWPTVLSRGPTVVPPVRATAWRYARRPLVSGVVLASGLLVFVITRVGPTDFFAPMQTGQDVTFMAGLGLPLWLGESVFLMVMLWICLRFRRLDSRVGTVGLLMLCGLFLAVKLLFGGLHGSRAATVWATFWFLLMFDAIVRPVNRREWSAIICGGMLFTYAYGFYKSVGADASAALLDQMARSGFADQYNRSVEDVVLGDLSRAPVHALLWERLGDRQVAPLGLGRTYLAAATLWLPSGLQSTNLPSKSIVGAAIESDVPISSARALPGTRQYGISGEASLNFGPAGFLLGAAGFVILVGLLDRRETTAFRTGSGADLLSVRLLATLLVSLMLSDADNLLILVIRLLPVLLLVRVAIQAGDPQRGWPAVEGSRTPVASL